MAETLTELDQQLDKVLDYGLAKLGMDRNTLKDKQRDAIKSLMNWNDTMVILPTGYGKSLVYHAAPFCLAYLIHAQKCSCNEDSHIEQKNIAVIVSPLTTLMFDQFKDLTDRVISAVNAHHLLPLQAQVQCLLTDKMSHQVTWHRFLNNLGHKD